MKRPRLAKPHHPHPAPRTWSGVQRDQVLDRGRVLSRRRRAVAGCRI